MDRPAPADLGGAGLLAGRLAASLPSGWLQLCGCALGEAGGRTVRVDCVLAHPAIGVALVDIAPPAGPAAPPDDDAVRLLLRRRLADAGFDAGGPFAGVLPVVRVRLPPDGLHGLIAALHAAFRREPARSVPGGYAWVGALRRALEPACEGAHGPIGVGSAPLAAEAATQHDVPQPRATPRGTGAAVALATATFALGVMVGSGLGTGWLAPPEWIALGPGSEDAAAPASATVAVGSASSSAWAGEGLAPPAGGQQTAAIPSAAVEDGRDATPPGNGTPAAVVAAAAVGAPEGLTVDTRAGRAPPERAREQGAPHDGRAGSARSAVQAAPGEARSVGRAPTIEPRCRETFYRYQLG
jgi:hypothetical protein